MSASLRSLLYLCNYSTKSFHRAAIALISKFLNAQILREARREACA